MSIDTASTAAIYGALRTRILTYAPPAGGTLQARGFKLYSGDYAAGAYPYGVGRLINSVTSRATDGGLRLAAGYELMLFGRPRNPWAERLEDYADVCDQAMHRLTAHDPAGSGGLLFTGDRTRDTLPPFPAPADREVVQVRLVYALVIYPRYLTTLGTPRVSA